MHATMMDVPLALNSLLERAGTLFAGNTIVSRRPDKSLKIHTYGEFHRRTRAFASALQQLGLKKGEWVATLCWDHHARCRSRRCSTPIAAVPRTSTGKFWKLWLLEQFPR